MDENNSAENQTKEDIIETDAPKEEKKIDIKKSKRNGNPCWKISNTPLQTWRVCRSNGK